METHPSTVPTLESESESSVAAPTQTLHPSIRTIWTIKLIGLSVLLVLAAFLYDLTHFFGSGEPWLPSGTTTLLVVVLSGSYSLIWPRLRYRYWSFELRPEELYLQRGVLNRVRTVVPLRRIQHLDVSQDLLEREFGLGRLIVHTAGSRSSDVVIPGLELDEAERIRDEVKRYILDDPLMEDPV